MKTRWLISVAMLATLAVTAADPGPAAAQPPRPGGPTVSPPISPYMNLLRRGTPPGINYYGLVRPQQELYNSANLLQRQIAENRRLIAGLAFSADPSLGETGHGTAFLDRGGYFMNRAPAPRDAGATPGPGGGPTARPALGGRTAAPRR